jgi:uncharacterized phage-like protein YoqJ
VILIRRDGKDEEVTLKKGRVMAISGHRPVKMGGYTLAAKQALVDFATEVLREAQPSKVISGMALGVDQAMAWAARRLDIPFVAAVPFEGQEHYWPLASQREYWELMASAAGKVVVSDNTHVIDAFQHRNVWMVDNSEALLALWDGSSGGTANCVNYALLKQARVINVWPAWERFRAQRTGH